MKWQQRVRVATGLSCWQIMLHLLVVAVLVMGWMGGALVRVGLGLCVLYGVTLLSIAVFTASLRRALARCR
nr:membrane protein [Raoultella sp. NCTC 9187]